MDRYLAAIAKWTGRLLILAAPYVLVSSLFLPAGVQVLNPLVCPDGTEISNARAVAPGQPDDVELELVCTSLTYNESATGAIMLVVVGSIAVGLGFLYVSQRLARPRYRAPGGHATR